MLTVLWILVLVAGAVYYSRHGQATIRQQTTISSGRPVVDRAVVDVVTAAGSDPLISMSDFAKVANCSITPVRSGAEYSRSIMLYAPPGSESTVLKTIADGLPARYRATSAAKPTPSLYADAGDFVAVLGSVKGPGQIQVRAVTGCRPLGDKLPAAASVEAPAPEVASVLNALGLQAGSIARTQVSCPDGGALVTDSATVPSSQVAGPLKDVKLSPAPTVATDDLYAYRSSVADVVVRESITGLIVTATTRC